MSPRSRPVTPPRVIPTPTLSATCAVALLLALASAPVAARAQDPGTEAARAEAIADFAALDRLGSDRRYVAYLVQRPTIPTQDGPAVLRDNPSYTVDNAALRFTPAFPKEGRRKPYWLNEGKEACLCSVGPGGREAPLPYTFSVRFTPSRDYLPEIREDGGWPVQFMIRNNRLGFVYLMVDTTGELTVGHRDGEGYHDLLTLSRASRVYYDRANDLRFDWLPSGYYRVTLNGYETVLPEGDKPTLPAPGRQQRFQHSTAVSYDHIELRYYDYDRAPGTLVQGFSERQVALFANTAFDNVVTGPHGDLVPDRNGGREVELHYYGLYEVGGGALPRPGEAGVGIVYVAGVREPFAAASPSTRAAFERRARKGAANQGASAPSAAELYGDSVESTEQKLVAVTFDADGEVVDASESDIADVIAAF